MRNFRKYLLITLILLTTTLCLTNCIMCDSACSSYIDNKTNGDIYLILEANTKNDIKTIAYFASKSNITKYTIDTLKNLGTIKIPSYEKLMTYSGPGLGPACNLKYLKIVTLDNIMEMKSTHEIDEKFEKNGVIFTMTIK